MEVDYYCNSRFTSDDDYDDDRRSDGFDSYCLSADVSESESCSSTTTLSCCGAGVGVAEQVAAASVNSTRLLDNSEFPVRFGTSLSGEHGRDDVTHQEMLEKPESSVVQLMKKRFAKLLLGEDMSGGAKGVCTALAISNAITNLAASVFGKLWKLEPLIPEKKSMWLQEMDWLLSVSDYIVELVPSMQEFPGGRTFEIMVTQSRHDLSVHLPALKKLDTMLVSILDGFHDSEFYYVDRGTIVADGEFIVAKHYPPSPGQTSTRTEEKWWLPFPKVPSNGLSEETKKRLQQCRECTNQIYKAAAAINSTVLKVIEIPKEYLDRLDKREKTCLGDILYRYITANDFSPQFLLHYLDLSSEHTALEIANRIESASHIWRQKYQKRKLDRNKTGRSTWKSAVNGVLHLEKMKIFAQRAETLVTNLKLQFPSLPQTALDTIKIQHNKDVGHAILESYSRVMESLAFNLMARIDDLLYVDNATRRRALEESASMISQGGSTDVLALQKHVSSGPISIQLNSCGPLLTRPTFCSGASLVRKPRRGDASLKEALHKKLGRINFQ